MSDDDATRLASSRRAAPTPTSDSGWLSSSGSIDHGRFAPGTILDSRYRIIGLAGRGGMGEVYRADDLRLGQPVALKFLPPLLSRDPVRLAQFHNEVRTARQVSHANVCRVYDIGETNGQLYITMEYVDGEDLSSLLRRIGRLPEDKGLEIARQICAGLGAAHERGILHRDLKPANVMLDGTGKVRVMDFSLAAIGEVQDIRAGTPAYMSPEQLSGQDVTIRSDIYALGLVLYEIFTGRRAFDARTLSDLIEQHHEGALTAPTAIVKGLDPAIEAAIMRCVEPEPSRRPASAIAVSAALPGGDPLAAALAAGETPSPEMVAAAGGDQAVMSRAAGVAWVAVAGVLILTCTWISGPTSLMARTPLQKPAVVLADRAESLLKSFGYTEPVVDRASAFQYDSYLTWADSHGSGKTRWAELSAGRPAAIRFWYRTSPSALVPESDTTSVDISDPPLNEHGMTLTVVDSEGRLLWFAAVPPQKENVTGTPPAHVDWAPLFAAAGLDRRALTETTPSWTPASYADERRAWSGMLPGTTTPITIQAAGYRGRAVDFKIVAAWTQAGREPSGGPARQQGTRPLFIYLLLGGATVAAYTHMTRGRADRRGAFAIAVFAVLLRTGIWAASPHVKDATAEQQRLFAALGVGMFLGGAMYLLYLGLEPFVRHAWPSMLVGWNRLLARHRRDPIIGRDLLLGVACGAGFGILHFAAEVLPAKFGLPEPIPHTPEFGPLVGASAYILTLLGCLNISLQNMLITLFEFAVFRWLFDWVVRRAGLPLNARTSERVFIAIAAVTLTMVGIVSNGGSSSERLLDAFNRGLSTSIVLVLLVRTGILATSIMFFVSYVLQRVPLTFNAEALYADASWFTIAWLIALAFAGFWMATTSAAPARVRAPLRVE